MRRFLFVLPLVITFLIGCVKDQPIETATLDAWPCSSTTIRHETYSEIIFDCPPGVWERMMAWHLAFHPRGDLIKEP